MVFRLFVVVFAVTLFSAILVGTAGAIAREEEKAEQVTVADSPTTIRPLLIGSYVPELTLQTPEGESFDLQSAIEKQPTILIFYRGGW